MGPRRRLAIVGAGGIAQSHVQAAKLIEDRAEVIAVVEVDRSRLSAFAGEHGIPGRYEDVETMLEEARPDLVIVCTPPYLHVPQTLSCLSAGAWVLCEKPVCGSLADLDAIEAAEAVTRARFFERVPMAVRRTHRKAQGPYPYPGLGAPTCPSSA